ncbi:hypothetical protein, partial [Streptomyces oceani]|uniref:hypothetical protein n=1 Tax=Streptomyces oceani TaxID=1075402 RepID=UPI001BAE73EF
MADQTGPYAEPAAASIAQATHVSLDHETHLTTALGAAVPTGTSRGRRRGGGYAAQRSALP